MKERKTQKFQPLWLLAILFVVYIILMGAFTISGAAGLVSNMFNKTATAAETHKSVDKYYTELLEFDVFPLADKGSYINMNGLMARIMGQRFVNERVKLDDGHLAATVERAEDVLPAIEEITKLWEKQTESGGAFLFVLTPYQISKYDPQLPAGFEDLRNLDGDELVEGLRERGIPVLDLREEMQKEDISHTDAFFVTDHHWKPETAFWAYTKIIENLQQQGAMPEIDPMYTDISSYNIDVYEDFFLGSSGKRTGAYFAGFDDFSVIYPKFETDMTVEIPYEGTVKRGSFYDAAFDWSGFEKNYFVTNPYGIYGFGDRGFTKYSNSLAPLDMRILFYGDSFGNAAGAFLPLVFQTFNELDMRYYQGNFAEYFAEYSPDIIVAVINAGNAVHENTTYEFFP